MTDTLQAVRDLQYNDKSRAEALLLSFIQTELGVSAVKVNLTPSAISLNSFNGFVKLDDGQRLFFKSHTETDTVIHEYYNSGLLSDAGYPVIRPVYSSTEPGKQFLMYQIIEDKSVFDVAWEIESGDLTLLPSLTEAQLGADQALYQIYSQSIALQSVANDEPQPIHQLFYHRLARGRLKRFYGTIEGEQGISIQLPGYKKSIPFAEIWHKRWRINGQVYRESLADIVKRALSTLKPAGGPSVIGHGDAHNGNVFLQRWPTPSVLYFDPAFAGRHHPLLDLAKPLFHNVFAMWMYFPEEKSNQVSITLKASADMWDIEYDYALPTVRRMFLDSKVQHVLKPAVADLHAMNQAANWRDILKSALFCCPFLTMNLADQERFTPAITLLGLAMSVEMGANSHEHLSLIDTLLDEIDPTLA